MACTHMAKDLTDSWTKISKYEIHADLNGYLYSTYRTKDMYSLKINIPPSNNSSINKEMIMKFSVQISSGM